MNTKQYCFFFLMKLQSKPTCFFSVIMNHYLLPLSLLVGKTQKLITIQAVHKVWHLIIGGIEKLDYQSDAQLQKVFTDLIVKWIPQFRLVCNNIKHNSKSNMFEFISIFLDTNKNASKTNFKTIYHMCTF